MAKFIVLFVSAFLVAAASGELVTPAPQTCKRNEVYLPQGKAPNCDTVCSELGDVCTRNYIIAPSGCYCVKNFARDAMNICIPIKKCPPKPEKPTIKPTPALNTCKTNEVWMDHGKNCDTICSELDEPCYQTWLVEPKGCYCADGFARDVNNACIQRSECPPKI